MFLEKVKDLDLIMLAPGHLLVELVTITSSIILAGSEDPQTDISHMKVRRSESDKFEVGDIILETSQGANDLKNYSEKGGVKYFTINGYNINMWTKQENFNTKPKQYTSIVTAA